ncbi:hypothetical protein ACWDTT_15775 [Streptosporangium sandarakinum]
MRINTIHLDGEGMPSSLAVTLTAAEAAFFARVLGKTNWTKCETFQIHGAYEELASLFNRFYDDGVNDYPTPAPSFVIEE